MWGYYFQSETASLISCVLEEHQILRSWNVAKIINLFKRVIVVSAVISRVYV